MLAFAVHGCGGTRVPGDFTADEVTRLLGRTTWAEHQARHPRPAMRHVMEPPRSVPSGIGLRIEPLDGAVARESGTHALDDLRIEPTCMGPFVIWLERATPTEVRYEIRQDVSGLWLDAGRLRIRLRPGEARVSASQDEVEADVATRLRALRAGPPAASEKRSASSSTP